MSRARARRLLLVGDTPEARRLRESFQQLAPGDWEWLGTASDTPVDVALQPWLGASDELPGLVSRHRPTHVVVALAHPPLALARTLLQLRDRAPTVLDVDTAHEELAQRFPLVGSEQAWAMALRCLSRRRPLSRAAKRSLDILVGLGAAAALVLVLPPAALALRLEGAWSVFVAERRVGLRGMRFTLLRLRTSRDAQGAGWPLAEPPPPLRTGAWLGRLRLDRLPRAFALLAGHLSLVGPRAVDEAAQERAERESPAFLLRTAVKPGLVGWEQLHRESRSLYDALRPLEYDMYYIKHQSLALDLRILLLAALSVLGFRRR